MVANLTSSNSWVFGDRNCHCKSHNPITRLSLKETLDELLLFFSTMTAAGISPVSNHLRLYEEEHVFIIQYRD
jgi:hypothetical protein